MKRLAVLALAYLFPGAALIVITVQAMLALVKK